MAVVLLITTDNEQPIELPMLNKCTVGRSTSCDLTIADKQMSGKHGVFELKPSGELFYSDLGSTNGSFLNNSQIQKIQFRLSETLRLGNTTFIIDEKRLNSKERMAIGRGIQENEDKTIVMPSNSTVATKSIIRGPDNLSKPAAPPPEEAPKAKKSIVLNKDLKKKAPVSDWAGGKKDNLIEQEESSGKTRFLKLDVNKAKKK